MVDESLRCGQAWTRPEGGLGVSQDEGVGWYRALSDAEFSRLCTFCATLKTVNQVVIAEQHHHANSGEPDASVEMIWWLEALSGRR